MGGWDWELGMAKEFGLKLEMGLGKRWDSAEIWLKCGCDRAGIGQVWE